MPWRGGRDEEFAWHDLPLAVRTTVEEALCGTVTDAKRMLGGFGWTPAFRLNLANGRHAFLKAVPPDLGEQMRESTRFMQTAYDREERVYTELGSFIAGWSPAFLGALRCNDWRLLLLEDLGEQTLPPWTEATVRSVMRSFAEFHRSTLEQPVPRWVRRLSKMLGTEGRGWGWIGGEADSTVAEVATVAGERAPEARRWLEEVAPIMATKARQVTLPQLPSALLHGDARSDNLRWLDGRLYLLDWPHVAVGPPEDDLVLFAQTIVLEAALEPESLVAWYAVDNDVHPEALAAAIACYCGFFAYHAWRSEVPGLPELRRFQRRQLCVMLRWATREFGLPPPTWLDSVDTGG